VEGLLILATLAQRFAPQLLPDYRVELEPMVSLRPRGGMPMRLQRR
jgi:cytochrome P450